MSPSVDLLEPFQFAFFRNGLAAATAAGASCGLVGVFVVLRGMSYIGHGLSHAVFGGAVVSSMLSLNFVVGAGVWGFACALLINAVARRRGIGADAAIGVVTTASFAIGLAVISRADGFTRDFDAALFGDVLGVTVGDLGLITVAGVFALGVVVVGYRALLFTSFDPEVAAASGIPVGRVDAVLALVLATTIIATMRILGVTLIAAALVVPAVVARMLTDRFGRMLWLSAALGAGCGFAGMHLSFHLDVGSGATIVLVGAGLFAVVFAVTGRRGHRRAAGLHTA